MLREATISAMTLAALLAATAGSTGGEAASAGDLITHMHSHFDRITQIQQAVIRGDLDATRDPARWLAEHEPPPGLEQNFSTYLTAMRKAANQTLNAKSVDQAAAGVSTMAMACAECHVESGGNAPFPRLTPPADEPGVRAHMQRHQWAADRLWEGLIGPSDQAWNQAVDLLVEVPLHPTDVSGETDRQITVLTRRVHELGAQGYVADSIEDRGDLYAEFLATCAQCHSRLNVNLGMTAKQ